MVIQLSNKLKSLFIPETRVVVFTGAGISAESGVPTFRGPEGLWKKFRVQDLATPEAFQARPQLVWEWYGWRRGQIAEVKPNPGHRAVSEFEKYFVDFTLVTQNVDGLHDRAGNRKLLKLHGDIWEIRCVQCGTARMDFTLSFNHLPPLCVCGGALRPGVVWFGEPLPAGIFDEAVQKAEGCDLFFSVGTSAEVYPAAYLPSIAKEHGAYVVEVNIESSAAASCADEVLLGKSGEVLPEILNYLSRASLD
ncbi:MAG: NAD-dependent protein deacylase [Acidobacteria bacterium]|nr:MAG: NAD-dependent protein deacylase [Acidobacteriota bacterium]